MTETKGYFGQFGGSFVPEPIQNLLNQLEETFEQYKNDPEFIAEYKHYLKDYSGRETPLYFAESLTEHLGGAKIYLKFKHQTGTFDNDTKVLTATLNDGVLNENAKTIVFPEVPNIFGVLPLYINSTDVPITYHYELNGDILTMYAEKTYDETGAHLVYPMKFKKVSDPRTN